MITRIEIDGFKTFQDFAVDLAPFQVIIGPNGCGKSNLFDALHFLSLLADHNVRDALQQVRGGPDEVFTQLPDGSYVDTMRFAVEMQVEHIFDEAEHWREVVLDDTNISYEVSISRYQNHSGIDEIIIEERWGYIQSEIRSTNTSEEESIIISTPYLNKEIGVIHQEMQSWRQFHPLSDALKQTNSRSDTPYLTREGKNLPNTLVRLRNEDPGFLVDISRDLTNIVPGVKRVEVDADQVRRRNEVFLRMRDGRRFSLNSVSEGTLRMLALVTLRNDPEHRGVLCFEEPENGLHPAALHHLMETLRGMATNFNLPNWNKRPLRQVLIATHSPEIVTQLKLEGGEEHSELLYAELVTRIQPPIGTMRVTHMTPVHATAPKEAKSSYALSRVMEYLQQGEVETTLKSLQKAFRP